VGLPSLLSQALAPWRSRRARHDPGKVLLDLAVAIALGGDCLADLAAVRCQPELFGEVASDPTVSRRTAQPTTSSIAPTIAAVTTDRSLSVLTYGGIA
jgi:hypothetical protein